MERYKAFGGMLMMGILIIFALSLASPQCRERSYLISVYWGKSTPIRFYGQVVDQSGKPIAGAQVAITVSTFNVATLVGSKEYLKEIRLSRTTDESGKFTVQGINGSTLSLEKISHPDFLPVPEREWHAGNYHALGYGYSRDRGVPYYVPDPQNPAVFPLRKEGEQRVLWPSRGGKDESNPW